MSQFRPNEAWTERESGDWEACVTTSYAEALLYGGVIMPAPYTQAQREKLEVVADEPQTLGQTDVKSLALFGVKLRPPSVTTSKAAFLARPGMGFCVTGVGSPVGAQAGTFTHEVFAVCVSLTLMRVYDPLLPPGSPPKDLSLTALAAWMNGIASHQAREVRKDEFVANVIVNATLFLGADGQPAPRGVSFAPGRTYVGYALDGTSERFTTGSSSTGAPADAKCTVSGTPWAIQGALYVRIRAGVFSDHPYVPMSQVGVTIAPDPVQPPADCSAQEAEIARLAGELGAALQRNDHLKGLIVRHNLVEDEMRAISG